MSKQRLTTPPWCPFCGQKVGRATDGIERKMHEFKVGRCGCGAVYSCDPTGHNIGSAIVETLVLACDNNWDFAWDLLPEDDYLTGRVEDYDELTHQVINTKNIDGRPVRGVLYFVRLHTAITEISKRVKEKKSALARQLSGDSDQDPIIIEPVLDPKRKKNKATKQDVKRYTDLGDIDTLVRLCFDDKKTLRLLQRLLYQPDEEQRWRIAWIIGQVCSRVATREPGQVSELIHRLFEACSDSAATPWGMVETLGEIISGRTDIFGAFTRHLLNYMGDSSTQIQVIWALNKIARVRPDLIRETPFFNLFHFMSHPNPAMRGQVARLLGRIKATEAAIQLMALTEDMAELSIWEDAKCVNYTVSALAREAVARINEGDVQQ
ncbi:MAG: HEAT repeat domain-containing protein [Proteobacteria bacterium]|nr:HEAT repeat domain-containing protein [Desulfocapsa sp.]MBU3943755.1 HEAT repeat domain-containing protein [Pseudomonadota bacterium]MCG2745638.1 HEAT repeat domain-containing protein [Desulfobacteraceae bacterium]MDO8947767.1 HEAT repeat domain-containing protein [Desulfocapsaceae bacterium]MBU3984010.1 HEAT repeat domain-containing protein [Pseudomonadota bacterium]